MKRSFLFSASIFLLVLSVAAQKKSGEQPKLIVGIVVDQMRFDYLQRFQSNFGEGGFKRLMNSGSNCTETNYSYEPTYTAPGHASIYSGTTPAVHGIIANNWYSKQEGKMVYCTSDITFRGVGYEGEAGSMSPNRMLVPAIGDALKTQYPEAKVIGISIKDRGAILPAGQRGDAAYWYVGKDQGKFISSTYYMRELPQWVNDFNGRKLPEKYLSGDWELSFDKALYHGAFGDRNQFEEPFEGAAYAVFPYKLDALREKNDDLTLVKETPFGNTLVAEFAKECIKQEALGKDNVPDMVTISFSSTDYVGHRFGTESFEVEDTYIRLDKDLAALFKFLDTEVGQGNYTLFLTADHGAIPPPALLSEQNIPSGYFNKEIFEKGVKAELAENGGDANALLSISNNQIFLNPKSFRSVKDWDQVKHNLKMAIQQFEGVDHVYTSEEVGTLNPDGKGGFVKKGFHPKRSGDLAFTLLPGWANYGKTGSTHGSSYAYDTHVPLLFYGNGIKSGTVHDAVGVEDIVPTLSRILNLEPPYAVTGKVIEGVLR